MFTACGIMHRGCCRPAPEDGRNYRPKHVELIGIINKPLLLHLVGCLYYCISDVWSYEHQMCGYIACFTNALKQNLPLKKYLTIRFLPHRKHLASSLQKANLLRH